MDQNVTHSISRGRAGQASWLMVLGAGIVAAGGYSIYLGTQNSNLHQQFVAAQHDNAALRQELSQTNADLQGALKSFRDDLAQAEQDTTASLQKATSAATRHADVVAARLAKKTADQADELNAQLGQVKQSTQDQSTKIDGITTDVGAVKTDVVAVKTDLSANKQAIETTQSDLQRARGDLGLMSGLIATNSTQIKELKDLGDRNIFEFTLTRNGKMEKVGDIEVMLQKADVGHNRFTMELLADDKKIQKKDKTVNEPVQFYTGKARQPYEIVVNEVSKNTVKGYLATPKVTIARSESASGPSADRQ
jgi:chromosome segregation ATPase